MINTKQIIIVVFLILLGILSIFVYPSDQLPQSTSTIQENFRNKTGIQPIFDTPRETPTILIKSTSEPINQDVDAQLVPEQLQGQIQVINERLEEEQTLPVIIEVTSQEQAQRFIQQYNLDRESLKAFEIFPFIAVEITQEDLELLKEDEELRAIQEDILLRPSLSQSIPLIGADNVTQNIGYNGSGITVVVLDTGVNKSHSAFQNRVVDEACYSAHNPGSNIYSLCPNNATEITGNNTGLDCDESIAGCGHGTHVAGIVAANHASGNGVAPGANIIAIKVFTEFNDAGSCNPYSPPCALAYFSDVTQGMERAYALRNNYTIAAVSISIGGGYYTANCDATFSSVKTAVDNLKSVGIATVISSGNDGYTNGMGAPACISTAISTGATTKADAVASYSNSASFLTILAPGSSIYAPFIDGGYGYKSGTSMATPHVSGAFALLRQAFPNKTVDEILQALQTTGTNLTKSSVTKARIHVDLAIANLTPSASYSSFDGETTNFSAEENLSNVCNPVLERSGQGRIGFTGCVNADGANLDQHVSINRTRVFVNSSALASWNKSATVTFYDTGIIEPIIVDDDTKQQCTHCAIVSQSGGNITITVGHFSSYTVVQNISLYLEDDTDTITKVVGDSVLFFANLSYTNTTPIVDATCSATYQTPNGNTSVGMTYNATSTFYENRTTFTAGGTYDWNVTCTHATNPTISGTDDYTIIEYGTLRAVFESHENEQTYQVNQNQTFTSASALYCDGTGVATCGNITAYHNDNRTGSMTQTATSTTTPVYSLNSQPQTCLDLVTGSPCYINWTLNTTGSTGTQFLIQHNFSSNLGSVSAIIGVTKTMLINALDNSNVSTQIAGANATVGTSGQYSLSGNSISATAGTTASIPLLGHQSTTKWQGFYGNISGSLQLGDGADTFYEFSSFSPYAVIATPSTNFNWSSVMGASPADVDVRWSFTNPADVDQAVDTFTKYKFFGDIANVPYATLNERFYSGIIRDESTASKNDFGFIGIVNNSGLQGFANRTVNYQVMVPVESGTENYYFYLAIE